MLFGVAATSGGRTSCGAATWSGGVLAQMEKTSTGLTVKARYYAYSVIGGSIVFALTFRNSSPNHRPLTHIEEIGALETSAFVQAHLPSRGPSTVGYFGETPFYNDESRT